MMPHESRILLASFAASLLVNGAVVLSFDRALSLREQVLTGEVMRASARQGELEFEFVESPAKVYPKKTEATKKISNRDALNQDLKEDKSNAAILPFTPTQGPADQLAQRQGSFPQTPAPKVEPAPESRKAEDADAMKAPTATQQAKPPSEPRPVVQGLTGRDKITTGEMSRSLSAGAKLFGVTSFEATGSGMGEYMKNLKDKIWLSWFPYIAFKFPQDFKTADAVILFRLDAKGNVKFVQITEHEGSPLFAEICVEAIQRASGFGPVPPGILALLGKDELEISFAFHYR